MGFTDLDRQKIKKEIGGLCEKKAPAQIKDELRYEYEINGHNVIIYEIRRVWNQKDQYTKMPIAKLSHVSSRKIWKLCWMRASRKWEKYAPKDTAADLKTLVQEIHHDRYGCFFG